MKKFFLLLFLLNTNRALSLENKGKQITFKSLGMEYLIKSSGDVAIITQNDSPYFTLIELKEKDEDSSITIVNRDKKHYICLANREIRSIVALKKMFMGKKEEEQKVEIKAKNEKDKIAEFDSEGYVLSGKDSSFELFLSILAEREIKKSTNIDKIISFISNIDTQELGLHLAVFDIMRSALPKIKGKGFLMKASVFEQGQAVNVYEVTKIEDANVDLSEFTIPTEFEKRGLEALMGEF